MNQTLRIPDRLLTEVEIERNNGRPFSSSLSVFALVPSSFCRTEIVRGPFHGAVTSLIQNDCSPFVSLLKIPCLSMRIERFAIATGLPFTLSLSLLTTNRKFAG